jgi:hypothetical protein
LKQFLSSYFNEHASYNPASGKNVLHLTPSYTVVYDRYLEWEQQQGFDDFASKGCFHGIWAKYFSNVKLSRKESFGLCNSCHWLQQMKDCASDDIERSARCMFVFFCLLLFAAVVAAALFDEHKLEFDVARRLYLQRVLYAEQHPHSVLHCCIDSMDSNKTLLPHWKMSREPKEFANCVRAPTPRLNLCFVIFTAGPVAAENNGRDFSRPMSLPLRLHQRLRPRPKPELDCPQ